MDSLIFFRVGLSPTQCLTLQATWSEERHRIGRTAEDLRVDPVNRRPLIAIEHVLQRHNYNGSDFFGDVADGGASIGRSADHRINIIARALIPWIITAEI